MKTSGRSRISRAVVGAAFCLGLAGPACGEREAGANANPRSAAAGQDVVGTITARFDGEERTWYVVAGEIEGERQATATWMLLDETERIATIGGFDSPDVPVETFRADFEGGDVSYGDYEGSVLTIAFPFQPEDFERLARFPGGDATIAYLPRVEGGEMDFSGMYGLETGSLDVGLLDPRRDGPSEFGGTFEGTLVRLDRADSIRVTDGRFEVSGATFVELDADGG